MTRLYFGKTEHARFQPVSHAFRYPVVYLGLDLPPHASPLESGELSPDQSSEQGAPPSPFRVGMAHLRSPQLLWQVVRLSLRALWNRYVVELRLDGDEEQWQWFPPLLSISAQDYLRHTSVDESHSNLPTKCSLRSKVLWECSRMLRQRDASLEAEADPATIGRIHLVTMPKLFGYAFNPVSFYFLYDAKTVPRLAYVLLEVHNTFGEAHLYLLDGAGDGGGVGVGKVERRFHVSPFNDQTGLYEIRFQDPLPSQKLHLSITYWEPLLNASSTLFSVKRALSPPSSPGKKNFYADVTAQGSVLTWQTLVYFLVWYPLTIFLTMPRILYEAFRLAYFKHLFVYPRPDPVSRDTITKFAPDPLEARCLDHVIRVLRKRVSQQEAFRLVLHTPTQAPLRLEPSKLRPHSTLQTVHMYWNTYQVFPLLLVCENAVEQLGCMLSEGQWYARMDGGWKEQEAYQLVWNLLDDWEKQGGNTGQKSSVSWISAWMDEWTAAVAKRFLFGTAEDLVSEAPARNPFRQDIPISLAHSLELFWGVVRTTIQHSIFHAITPWAPNLDPAPWLARKRFRKKCALVPALEGPALWHHLDQHQPREIHSKKE